jgi:large subunit ribosomal protein L25
MSQKYELIAEDRSEQGRGASRRLRRAGKVPAILYGARRDPRPLVLDHATLLHQTESESFFSSILTITIGEKSQPCIVKDLQRHPYKNQIVHVDLQRILEDEKIRVTVPVHFIGEKTAPGLKQGGIVSHIITELEISCLPKDLPEFIDADMSAVELDVLLYVSDLQVPEGVEVLGGPEMMAKAVANIHRPKAEEEEEAGEEEIPGVEVEGAEGAEEPPEESSE